MIKILLKFLVIITVFGATINPAFAGTKVLLASGEKTTLASGEKTLMAFGDSLTAGLGLPLKDAYPAQLETEMRAKGLDIKVINAGVSGETTSGALSRLEWTLMQNPDAVIVETGANDMLRAIDPGVTRKNLDAILKILKDRKIPVLVTGMKSFANFGPDYVARYEKVFPDLAKKYDMAYYPFFMDGIALNRDLLQTDGLHPNAAGAKAIAAKIAPYAEKLLKP